LAGAVVLIGGVIVVLRQPALRARPRLRRDWRAFSGVLLVAGGLVAWLIALTEASPWFRYNEPALLLAAGCLPQVVLDPNIAERLFGLVTVTVLAPWVASGHVQALIIEDLPVDAGATVVALVPVFCSVAGCYLAQARLRRGPREGATPATERR
jgi:di/tricarboxylate transporter